MAFVNVNGMDFYYREAGTGDPLLLVHGTGFNAEVWDGVFDSLAQDYRTIAYDRRGYQQSRGELPPTSRYGHQQGDDMIALLEALHATPATIVGWSAGAIYALYATLKCPELFKRLILYEPALHASRYFDLSAGRAILALFILKAVGKKQAAANRFVRWVLAYRDGRNSYDWLSPEYCAKLAEDSNTLLAEFDGGTGEDLTPEILAAQIKLPVTLLVGEQTAPSMHKLANNLAGILHAPIVLLPDANHLAQVDQPAEFAAAIKSVLG